MPRSTTDRTSRPSGGPHYQALMDRDGIYAELFNPQAEGYRA